jgi:hypothetical protein
VSESFANVGGSERGERRGLIARRVVMSLLAVIPLLALLDVFGQRPTSTTAAAPRARMELSAPDAVRGGLFFQSRIEIHALDRIAHPRLVLDEGWLEGMQVNSIEPAPGDEESRDGRLVLSYTTLEKGDVLKVWLQFEVDPTTGAGRRAYGLALDDDQTPVARIAHTLNVFP